MADKHLIRLPRLKRAPKTLRERLDRVTVVKIIVCVLVFVLLCIPPMFANTAVGYVPLIAYVLAMALSCGYLAVLSRGLVFEQESLDEGCERGETVHFKLVVTNNSPLPALRVESQFYISDLFGDEGATSWRSITMPPLTNKTFDFDVRFDHIGSYEVGIKRITVFDLLGLFRHTVENEVFDEVMVTPRIVRPGHLRISNDSMTESLKPITTVLNEGMDYSQVREYIWGDPIKSIHWKLSAKGDTFYTRLYEIMTSPGVAVVMDLEAPAYSASDLMEVNDAIIECTLSVERFASVNSMTTELLFENNGDYRRLKGPVPTTAFPELVEQLPKIKVGDGRGAMDALAREASSAYAQSNLVLVTSNVSNELSAAILAARSGKHTPLVIAVVPRSMESEERKELAKPLHVLGDAGVYCTLVSEVDDLVERG